MGRLRRAKEKKKIIKRGEAGYLFAVGTMASVPEGAYVAQHKVQLRQYGGLAQRLSRVQVLVGCLWKTLSPGRPCSTAY